MSGLLSVVGFLGLLVALVGLVKGSVRTLGLGTRGGCAKAAVVAFVVMTIGGALAPDPGPAADRVQPAALPQPAAPSAEPSAPAPSRSPSPEVSATAAAPASPAVVPQASPEPVRTTAAPAPLLQMAAGGDGDSWRDTDGVEYRMGLVNTPETNECGGAAATRYRRQALAGGFRATVYETDRYGRQVAVVFAPNGVNLNVAMARDGIADDTFLEQFRHENPRLAAQLDVAFREARAAGRGIWTACRAPAAEPEEPPAPQPIVGGGGGDCHPDYRNCIPVKGDGSGRGAANDLDCGDLSETVYLRQVGRDPYRLDGSDQDGIGCE